MDQLPQKPLSRDGREFVLVRPGCNPEQRGVVPFRVNKTRGEALADRKTTPPVKK